MKVHASAIRVEQLSVGYQSGVILEDLNFVVRKGEIKGIVGASGCGKSTLLRHLMGLDQAMRGRIFFGEEAFEASNPAFASMRQRCGVLFQGSALWSDQTVHENIALPLQQKTRLSPSEIDGIVALKLALVGLTGMGGKYPSELSGGMRKRAGLARAIALDPEIILLDEPSAGLDPVSSERLDQLILELRSFLGASIVVVSHELSSLFRIADSLLFLDSTCKGVIADAHPRQLLADPLVDPKVKHFLSRGTQMPQMKLPSDSIGMNTANKERF